MDHERVVNLPSAASSPLLFNSESFADRGVLSDYLFPEDGASLSFKLFMGILDQLILFFDG